MSALERAPERELRAEAYVEAPPAEVWSVLTDLDRMPAWSPELVRMVPLKPGGLRVGQWYLGLNRRGWALWPTRNVVAQLESGRLIAWDTVTSGARWIWEVIPEGSGTRVVHRRPVPRRITVVALVYGHIFLGGIAHHVDQLEGDMQLSVERFAQVFSGPAR